MAEKVERFDLVGEPLHHFKWIKAYNSTLSTNVVTDSNNWRKYLQLLWEHRSLQRVPENEKLEVYVLDGKERTGSILMVPCKELYYGFQLEEIL